MIKIIFFAYFLSLQSFSINAGEIPESDEVKPEKSNVVKQGTPMSEEEIEKKIGRYGEGDEVPEDFQFADAENNFNKYACFRSITKYRPVFFAAR